MRHGGNETEQLCKSALHPTMGRRDVNCWYVCKKISCENKFVPGLYLVALGHSNEEAVEVLEAKVARQSQVPVTASEAVPRVDFPKKGVGWATLPVAPLPVALPA